MSDPSVLPGQDFLGKCYDIVKLDPLDLVTSAKYVNAIDISASSDKTQDTGDGRYRIPLGAEYKGVPTMSWESQSRTISSMRDFVEEFKSTVSANAGVEGGFDFSGSSTCSNVEKDTQKRKQTFVYSRAYKQNHGLRLDFHDEGAQIRLTKHFETEVTKLPGGKFEEVRDAYLEFVSNFGTHFTTEIILGGLAFQRTIGSVERYLRSTTTEEELKISGSVVIEDIKAGAGADDWKKHALTVDQKNQLQRISLDYRGGDAKPGPEGIDDGWIKSLRDYPAVVKAQLERLSYLLTPRFFPKDNQISEKRVLLDAAIDTWILETGKPSRDTAPLRYGEPFALVLSAASMPDYSRLGLLLDPGQTRDVFSIKFSYIPTTFGPLVAPLGLIVLESATGSRDRGVILDGDKVRVRFADGPYFGQEIGHEGYMKARTVDQPGEASVITVCFNGEDPDHPARAGEYVLETDELRFFPDWPGTGHGALWVGSAGYLAYHQKNFKPAAFSLRRAGTQEN